MRSIRTMKHSGRKFLICLAIWLVLAVAWGAFSISTGRGFSLGFCYINHIEFCSTPGFYGSPACLTFCYGNGHNKYYPYQGQIAYFKIEYGLPRHFGFTFP